MAVSSERSMMSKIIEMKIQSIDFLSDIFIVVDTSSWGGVLECDDDGVLIDKYSKDEDDGVLIERSSEDELEADEAGIKSRDQWNEGKELWQRVRRFPLTEDTVWRINGASL